jgi:hypothetical protein
MAAVAPKARAAIAIEGIRVASEVRRHGHPHRAAAGPAALRFGIGPNVWALMRPGERFKRPRVNEQIGHRFSWSMHPGATAGRRRALPRRAEVAVGITAGARGEAEAACSPRRVSARAPLLPRALPGAKIRKSDQRACDRGMVAVRPVWLTKG